MLSRSADATLPWNEVKSGCPLYYGLNGRAGRVGERVKGVSGIKGKKEKVNWIKGGEGERELKGINCKEGSVTGNKRRVRIELVEGVDGKGDGRREVWREFR